MQQYWYFWVWTIFLNVWFFIAKLHKRARSSAQDIFWGLFMPWTLAKLLFARPIFFAILFISLRNGLTKHPWRRSKALLMTSTFRESSFFWTRYPPISAIKKAASLPLGSIIPYNKSSTQYKAWFLISAVVPSTKLEAFVAWIFKFFAFKPYRSRMSRIVIKFMIFVKLANYRIFFDLFAYSVFPCFI